MIATVKATLARNTLCDDRDAVCAHAARKDSLSTTAIEPLISSRCQTADVRAAGAPIAGRCHLTMSLISTPPIGCLQVVRTWSPNQPLPNVTRSLRSGHCRHPDLSNV